ncbi:MAG TPA: glycosyltransferase [Thermoanaerobaculia bacterium]|jgi:glycosyltransferase involved in cell wall biosynthesis|nr:glycosyltransferase [Thermoanaerobaculia bacterium]
MESRGRPVPVCTIASNNYLAKAKVLVESYLTAHPGAEAYVCVVDEPVHPASAKIPARIVGADQLGIPGFANMAFRYDALELNTAVKPFFLEYLRDRCGCARMFFLDPDIVVFDELQGLMQALEKHPIVLTPHIAQPLEEGWRAGERQFLRAGVFNLGFLGICLDERTRAFLDWWKERLSRFCVDDIPSGLFVDQIWLNFAPCFVDGVHVAREPIYNIAWWNLSQRTLEVQDGCPAIGGRRVGFMHFSGFAVSSDDRITKHRTDLLLADREDLRPWYSEFSERVLAAGDAGLRAISYGYATFRGTGVPVIPAFRRLLHRLDPSGVRWSDPFAFESPESFAGWLAEPLEFAEGVLTRAALALWEHRTDLVRAFPRVCDEDLPRYVDWLVRYGEGAKEGLDAAFLNELKVNPKKERFIAGRFEATIAPHSANADLQHTSLLETIDLSAPGSLARWLNEPAGGTAQMPCITHLAMVIHASRIDLQEAFPQPLEEDRQAFGEWFASQAPTEYALSAELQVRPETMPRPLPAKAALRARCRSVLSTAKRLVELLAARPRTAPPPPAVSVAGLNVAGYLEASSGVAELARASLELLSDLRMPFVRVPLDQDYSENVIETRIFHPEGTPFPVTLLHANAAEMPAVLSTLPQAFLQGSFRIACWAWELAHFPLSWADRFSGVDEVWAHSRFSQQAFESLSTVPVRWVAPYVRQVHGNADRGRFGMDARRFYFFAAADFRSLPRRKNPQGAVEALAALLAKTNRDVGLVLKVQHGQSDPDAFENLRRAAGGLPVVLCSQTLSRQEYSDLLASCDAVLSLHRSEGLGLVPIEALYRRMPVVATAYGGITDYLDEETGFPVEYSLARLESDVGPYPRGAVWAEPHLESAVEQMKILLDDPREATARALRGACRVDGIYGRAASGHRWQNELQRVFRAAGLPGGDSRDRGQTAWRRSHFAVESPLPKDL